MMTLASKNTHHRMLKHGATLLLLIQANLLCLHIQVAWGAWFLGSKPHVIPNSRELKSIHSILVSVPKNL